MRAILFKDGVEVKRTRYPRRDGAPVEGLDAGLEWKIIREQPVPIYDSRLFNLNIVEDNSDDFDLEFPHLKQFKISYTTVKKPNSLINEEIQKAEQEANEQIVNNKKRDKFLLLGLGILIRKSNGVNITQKEENILDILLDKAINVWQNDAELQNKLQQVVDGNTPDLDSGWNTNE